MWPSFCFPSEPVWERAQLWHQFAEGNSNEVWHVIAFASTWYVHRTYIHAYNNDYYSQNRWVPPHQLAQNRTKSFLKSHLHKFFLMRLQFHEIVFHFLWLFKSPPWIIIKDYYLDTSIRYDFNLVSASLCKFHPASA